MLFWAQNVNITDPLVVTAGSALKNYPWWTSRELRRTSGSHFPRVWILDLIFGNVGGPFWLILADSGASRPQKSIPDDLTDLGTQHESSGACLRPNLGHVHQKCEQFLRNSNFEIKKSAIQSLDFLSRSFLSGSWAV